MYINILCITWRLSFKITDAKLKNGVLRAELLKVALKGIDLAYSV